MRHYGLVLKITLATAVLLTAGSVVCHAQSGKRQKGKLVEFADPRSFDVSTNLVHLDPAPNPLQGMENEGVVPQGSLNTRGSLSGTLIPPVQPTRRPVVPSKRAQEMLKEKRNWMFAAPEESTFGLTPEEMLNVPDYATDDGTDETDSSGAKRKKQDQNQRTGSETQSDPADSRQTFGEKDQDLRLRPSSRSDRLSPDSPGRRTESALSAHNPLLGVPDADPSYVSRELEAGKEGGLFDSKDGEKKGVFSKSGEFSSSDIFGGEEPSKKALAAQKARMENFKQMMEGAPPNLSPSQPSSMAGADALAILGNAGDAKPLSPAGGELPAVNLQNSALSAPRLDSRVTSMPGFGGASSDYSSKLAIPAARAPRIEPVRIAPPAPSFAAPRREF